MKAIWSLLFLGSLLAACNGSESAAKTIGNAQDTLQEAVVDNEVAVTRQSFPQVFHYLRQQDSTFSEDSFLLAGEQQLEAVAPTRMDTAQLKPFQAYFIYNPDSSLALDLYSYNYIVTHRNGKSSLEEAGPDVEAAVLNFRNHTRRRVFFGGPSHTLWDAKWIKQEELLLIGAEAHDETVIPTIWQINLKDTTMQVFAYKGDVKADMTGYQQQKLAKGL